MSEINIELMLSNHLADSITALRHSIRQSVEAVDEQQARLLRLVAIADAAGVPIPPESTTLPPLLTDGELTVEVDGVD